MPYIEASRGLISSKQKDLCWWKEGSWKAGGQSAGETDTHLHLDVDLDNFLTETLRFWEYPIFLYLFNAYLPITPGFTESSQLTSKIQRFPGTFSCDGGAGGSSNFSPTAKLMRKEAATRWVFKVIDLEIIGIIDGSLQLMPRKVQDQGSGVWGCGALQSPQLTTLRIGRGLRITGALVWVGEICLQLQYMETHIPNSFPPSVKSVEKKWERQKAKGGPNSFVFTYWKRWKDGSHISFAKLQHFSYHCKIVISIEILTLDITVGNQMGHCNC